MKEKGNLYNDSSVVTNERMCSETLCELLKKRGFNELCRSFWKPLGSGDRVLMTCDGENLTVCNNRSLEGLFDNALAAPTHQMASDWLVNAKRIYIKIDLCPANNAKGYVYIGVVKDLSNKCMPFETPLDELSYESEEDAFETLAKYTLEELL